MLQAESKYQLFANASPDQSGHQVVLHGLDTWRDYSYPDGTKKLLYFGVDNFSGTEPDWNNTTLIYGTKHPSASFRQNKESALEECGGREVGSFKDATTILNGSPRFEGSFSFNDSEVQALHDSGELQFSSGFLADIDDEGKLVGKVVPDHILVFKKSKDGLQPQEPLSFFLNATATETHMDAESKGYLKSILEVLGKLVPKQPVLNAITPIDPEKSLESITEDVCDALSKAVGATYSDGSPRNVWITMTLPDSVIWEHPVSGEYYLTKYQAVNGAYEFGDSVKVQRTFTEKPQDTQMTNEFDQKIAVLNATIETQNTSLTEKDATIADLTGKVQAFEAEKAQAAATAQEAAWQNIKANVLAPGLTATPELEAEQKAAWMADKDGFYCNAIAAQQQRPPAKGKSGEMFANAAGQSDDAEMDAILSSRPGIPGSFH